MGNRQRQFWRGSEAVQAAMGKSGGRGMDQTCIILLRQPTKDDHPSIKVADEGRAQGLVARSSRSGFSCCLDIIFSGFVILESIQNWVGKVSFAIHFS